MTITPAGGYDIDLDWNDLSYLEEGYDVEHRVNGGSWSTMDELSAGTTTYTNYDVICKAGENNHEYRIKVYANETTLDGYSPIRGYDPCMAPRVAVAPPKLATPFTDGAPTLSITPTETELVGSYPNPFNPSTVVRYSLKETSEVRLSVYNLLGRLVAELVSGVQNEGRHEAVFDGGHLPSGVYQVVLATPSSTHSQTVLLLK